MMKMYDASRNKAVFYSPNSNRMVAVVPVDSRDFPFPICQITVFDNYNGHDHIVARGNNYAIPFRKIPGAYKMGMTMIPVQKAMFHRPGLVSSLQNVCDMIHENFDRYYLPYINHKI